MLITNLTNIFDLIKLGKEVLYLGTWEYIQTSRWTLLSIQIPTIFSRVKVQKCVQTITLGARRGNKYFWLNSWTEE